MEASAAGLAAGGEATQQQDQQGQQGAAQGQGPAQGADQGTQQQTVDFGALQQQLESMAGTQEEMRQFLAQQVQQAQTPAVQPQEQPMDLSFLEQETDPAVAAQRLQEAIDGRADQRVQALLQEHLAPLQEQVMHTRLNQEADQLVAEFPDLGSPEVAQAVMASANQLATTMGQPELASNTQFVRTVYMAGRAAQMAQQQQEGAAGAPGVATLEGGGGAGPAASAQGGETADSISQQWAQRRSVLPRW